MDVSTRAQIDLLVAAINSGATSISYNGKTIQYRTLDEMRAILRMHGVVITPTGWEQVSGRKRTMVQPVSLASYREGRH